MNLTEFKIVFKKHPLTEFVAALKKTHFLEKQCFATATVYLPPFFGLHMCTRYIYLSATPPPHHVHITMFVGTESYLTFVSVLVVFVMRSFLGSSMWF